MKCFGDLTCNRHSRSRHAGNGSDVIGNGGNQLLDSGRAIHRPYPPDVLLPFPLWTDGLQDPQFILVTTDLWIQTWVPRTLLTILRENPVHVGARL